MTNTLSAMTVDVEDYFHASALSSMVSPHDWGNAKFPLRVESAINAILDLFDTYNVKATFFVLGWVAETCPSLVKAIASRGHEIASHGFAHQLASSQSRRIFYADIARSKNIIESITGHSIYGYRAPSFSIGDSNSWAFEILQELGFTFSSSTYPVKHDLYGVPNWPRFLHQRPEGITEIPIPTLSIMGKNIPIGGGGFFRLYPYSLSRALINRYRQETGQPYSFYFHPWEVDPAQPRISGLPFKSIFRHYLNLNRTIPRLTQLLGDYQWDTMSNVYGLTGQEHNGTSSNPKINAKRLPSVGSVC